MVRDFYSRVGDVGGGLGERRLLIGSMVFGISVVFLVILGVVGVGFYVYLKVGLRVDFEFKLFLWV